MQGSASSLRGKVLKALSLKLNICEYLATPGIECCCNALPFTRGILAKVGPAAALYRLSHRHIGADSTPSQMLISTADRGAQAVGTCAQHRMAQDIGTSHRRRALPQRMVHRVLHVHSPPGMLHGAYTIEMLCSDRGKGTGATPSWRSLRTHSWRAFVHPYILRIFTLHRDRESDTGLCCS